MFPLRAADVVVAQHDVMGLLRRRSYGRAVPSTLAKNAVAKVDRVIRGGVVGMSALAL